MAKKIILIALLFLSLANSANALEITYPNIVPGIPAPNQDSDLPVFVGYFFGLGIMLGIFVAVLSLAIGGAQLIFSGAVEGHAEAVDRIKGSVLGLFLLLSSFIILKTINPYLATPVMNPLPGVAGVFYIKGGDINQTKPADQENPDVENIIPAEYRTLYYKCDNIDTAPKLLFWAYDKTNYADCIGTQEIQCNETTPINIKSFKLAYKTPGIYYFTGEGCSGCASTVKTTDESVISADFRKKIKSVNIVNDPDWGIFYGFLPHAEVNFGGACVAPLMSEGYASCEDISVPVSSAHIFNWNYTGYLYSGNGINFYSDDFGWNAGANSRMVELKPDAISVDWWGLPQCVKFSKFKTSDDQAGKDLCKKNNFKECPGSIRVNGDYMVILFSQGKAGSQPDNWSEECKEKCPLEGCAAAGMQTAASNCMADCAQGGSADFNTCYDDCAADCEDGDTECQADCGMTCAAETGNTNGECFEGCSDSCQTQATDALDACSECYEECEGFAEQQGAFYCDVFTVSAENLKARNFAAEGKKFQSIEVIPLGAYTPTPVE